MADALAGRSRVTVLRGEAGVGKSALLGYLSGRVAGWHVARAAGVESEMELAYAGLHQLCAPMLDHLGRLPVPQRDALATVFGRSAGAAPDRFLVGLATLTLFAEVAEQQPLACVVDDAQWLDHASAQILGFVARRLLAERIAVVCAARTGAGDDVLAGLPELSVRGLGDSDARALLLANVPGPLDAAVCDQIVRRATATRSPCSSCRARGTSPVSPAGSVFPAASRSPAGSSRATSGASSCSRPTPGCSCSRPPPSLSATLSCSTGPRGRSGSTSRRRALRRTAGCSSWAGGSSSRTRSSGPPPTARPPRTTGTACIVRWPRPPPPRPTRTGGPGTAPAPRRGPTRRSPPSSNARPAVRRPAAASLRRPRSCNDPPS